MLPEIRKSRRGSTAQADSRTGPSVHPDDPQPRRISSREHAPYGSIEIL